MCQRVCCVTHLAIAKKKAARTLQALDENRSETGDHRVPIVSGPATAVPAGSSSPKPPPSAQEVSGQPGYGACRVIWTRESLA